METDREAIRTLYQHYAFLVDGGRPADVADHIFAADAVVNYGVDRSLRGAAEIRANFESYHDVLEATSHTITGAVINVEGDSTRTLVRVLGWHWFLSTQEHGPDRSTDYLQIAAHQDRLRREPRGWRVVERRVHALGPGGQGTGIGDPPPWRRFQPPLSEAVWPFDAI